MYETTVPSVKCMVIARVIFRKKVTPCNIYLFKFNNRNTRKRCGICSKLTIKTPERGDWRRSGVFIVNYRHISHLFWFFYCYFKQVNVSRNMHMFHGKRVYLQSTFSMSTLIHCWYNDTTATMKRKIQIEKILGENFPGKCCCWGLLFAQK